MRSKNVHVLIFVCMILSSCADAGLNVADYEHKNSDKIEFGITTKEELREMIGTADDVVFRKDGVEEWRYQNAIYIFDGSGALTSMIMGWVGCFGSMP